MSPLELRRIVATLDPGGPIHLQLTADLRRGRRSAPWYRNQREHLLGWLGEYSGPGAYGRADSNRTAAFVYRHFQCAPGLAWLAEAAGVPDPVLKRACEAVRMAGRNHAAQCGAFRRVVPWAVVRDRLPCVPAEPGLQVIGASQRPAPTSVNDNAAPG